MGLQNQLNDVSSESILLLLIALIANCVACLRSFLFSVFHSVGVHRLEQARVVDDRLMGSMGSGLAGLIVLAEQRKLNRVFAYNYCCDRDDRNDKGGSDCVVCLCTLRDGDQARGGEFSGVVLLEMKHVRDDDGDGYSMMIIGE
ncbi:hypothetical protein DKX38_012907 [Salix brachista]|uniref:Uncharacterized protein n=1 Tax=Salix brachista TaxID=2182728 RepID=A0A5N5LPQ6_9ROSI|nr:hypothetical protein DKX38_012907 [Salix brachista]